MPKIASVNISTPGLRVHPYSVMVLCFVEKQKNFKTLKLMDWRWVTFENVKGWSSFKVRIH